MTATPVLCCCCRHATPVLFRVIRIQPHEDPALQEWVTIETSCTAGFGLVDVEGQFLANRSGASTCERCAAGFFSQEPLGLKQSGQ